MGVQARPCKSCGTMIYDLDHENPPRDGKRHRAPITVAVDEGQGFRLPSGKTVRGNIQVDLQAGTYRVLSRVRAEAVGYVGLRINHFLDCTEPDRWSRPLARRAGWPDG
jgi:hypothetical protein